MWTWKYSVYRQTYLDPWTLGWFMVFNTTFTKIPKHASPTDKSGKNQFGPENIGFHQTDCPV